MAGFNISVRNEWTLISDTIEVKVIDDHIYVYVPYHTGALIYRYDPLYNIWLLNNHDTTKRQIVRLLPSQMYVVSKSSNDHCRYITLICRINMQICNGTI